MTATPEPTATPAVGDELLIAILDAHADLLASRIQTERSQEARDRALYAAWRRNPNPRAIAAMLPKGITTATVRRAVVKNAPPADFEQLDLLAIAAAVTTNANA